MNMSKYAVDLPTTEQLEKERKRLRYKRRYSRTLRSTVAILIVVAAAACSGRHALGCRCCGSTAAPWSPRSPTGRLSSPSKPPASSRADIAAFYHGNKLLIKRYIAGPSDWVNIDQNGNVSVYAERRSTNRIWWKKPTAKRTLSCRIRSRMSAIS